METLETSRPWDLHRCRGDLTLERSLHAPPLLCLWALSCLSWATLRLHVSNADFLGETCFYSCSSSHPPKFWEIDFVCSSSESEMEGEQQAGTNLTSCLTWCCPCLSDQVLKRSSQEILLVWKRWWCPSVHLCLLVVKELNSTVTWFLAVHNNAKQP